MPPSIRLLTSEEPKKKKKLSKYGRCSVDVIKFLSKISGTTCDACAGALSRCDIRRLNALATISKEKLSIYNMPGLNYKVNSFSTRYDIKIGRTFQYFYGTYRRKTRTIPRLCYSSLSSTFFLL